MSLDDFSDFPAVSDNAATETAAPAQTGVNASDYLGHVQALIKAGATGDQVRQYVQSVGADPAKIQGLDEAVARQAQGQETPVVLQGQQAQPQAAPAQAEDFSDFAPAQSDNSVGASLGRGVRDVMSGIGSAADLISSPIAVPLQAAGVDTGHYRELANTLADKLGLARSDTNAQKIISALDEGGLLGLATAGAGGALAALPGVAGATGAALAATPVADTLANAGSNAATEIARQNGAGTVGQLAAGALGGGAAALGSVGAPAVARRLSASSEPSELLAAFNRQQVQPMADQVGGTGARAASGIARMTLGGIPLAQAAEKSIASLKSARDRIAGVMGYVADDTGAGQAAQRGARSMIETTGNTASRLYNAIPIASKKEAVTNGGKAALADLNAGLESNPELSGLIADKRLQAWEKALAGTSQEVPTGILDANGNPITRTVQKGGKLSWEDLKSFRSYVGELAGQQTLQDSTPKKALQQLYAGLSDDMRTTAKADGPKALAAFERANTYYRARQDRIDNTLSQILGDKLDKSPEAAFAQIERWSRNGGDSAALARTMRSLPEDEASTVRASVFSRLGNVSPGRQDLTGTVFSPNDFATSWAKLDSRAKSVLFPGQEYRRDVDDIARIADSMKRSSEFANTSKTAFAGNGIGLITLALAGHPLEAGGIATSQFAFGKLLSSPRFARWLASSPKKPVGPATLAHINRLTAIATAEPAIANEVLALQERLASAFTATPTRAAADTGDNQ